MSALGTPVDLVSRSCASPVEKGANNPMSGVHFRQCLLDQTQPEDAVFEIVGNLG